MFAWPKPSTSVHPPSATKTLNPVSSCSVTAQEKIAELLFEICRETSWHRANSFSDQLTVLRRYSRVAVLLYDPVEELVFCSISTESQDLLGGSIRQRYNMVQRCENVKPLDTSCNLRSDVCVPQLIHSHALLLWPPLPHRPGNDNICAKARELQQHQQGRGVGSQLRRKARLGRLEAASPNLFQESCHTLAPTTPNTRSLSHSLELLRFFFDGLSQFSLPLPRPSELFLPKECLLTESGHLGESLMPLGAPGILKSFEIVIG
jgi:hypothetical protein